MITIHAITNITTIIRSITCATDSKTYDLEGWQALGYDEGTTVSEAPDTDTIMQWARDLMGL